MKPCLIRICAGALRRGKACEDGRVGPTGFLRDRRAGAAVDFALTLFPFLIVLMVMINSALLLLAGQVLQTAATSAARLVLTGQAQNGNYTATQFKNNVCASLTVMFNCANNLYIDVESTSSSSFNSINLANPTNANGTLNTSGFGYSLGNPGDLVIVRLIYQWPLAGSGLVGALMNPISPNNYTLVATVAFRNEPYTPGGG
jgi:Flp pilus assembly protein TadG